MHRYTLLQFLLIYRKARAGELEQDSGLSQLARLTEVDVDEVGVTGAKHFFEAKVHIYNFFIVKKYFSDFFLINNSRFFFLFNSLSQIF